MTRQILGAGLVFALLAGATGCGLARPLLLWREPAIFGKAKLLDVDGKAFKDEKSHAVTVNFINLEGRIEESVISVRTDDKGRYRSPELPPGEYAVEAHLSGFALEKETVKVRSHEHKKVNFELQRIREAAGHFMREAEDDNIPHAGEVQIGPPPF